MGARKGYPYPFSRMAYKQVWGILSNTILGLLGLGVCAAKGIKNAVESSSTAVNEEKKEGADTSDIAKTILFILLAVVLVGVVLVVLAPLVSLLAPILAVGLLSSIVGIFTKH